MTKTMPSCSALDRLKGWLGDEAGEALYDYLTTAATKNGAPLFSGVDEALDGLTPPMFFSPIPSEPGCYFDITFVDRFLRFCRKLRHIKGSKWAGRRFSPDVWQVVFIIAPLFGWRGADGKRLYRTLYLEIPKKNGKSTLAAAIALYLLSADQEPGAEVVSAAGDKDQARAVYEVAQNMVKMAPALAKRLRPLKNQITYEETASWYRVLSADGDLKAGLNLHGAVIDELLVQKKRDLVDNLEAAVASREQPIVAFLTTAGLDQVGSIYTEKRNYSEQVAKGEREDATWLSVIYTVDKEADWTDPKVWAQANPGLGISVQLDYLKRKCAQAQASAQSQNKFLRDHLNIRTGQVTRWLDVGKWDRSGSYWLTPELDRLFGEVAYGGMDLASSTDLAAVSLIVPEWMPNPENRDEEVLTFNWFLWAWTPAATLDEREKRDQVPYQEWVDGGLLLTTPGDVIDYDTIEEKVVELAERFEFRRFHYDRWGSHQISQHLANEALNVWPMGQGFASMSPPMKDLQREILLGRVRHGRNALLRYSVQSLAAVVDKNDNIKPDRDASTGRIDPFVSGIMAFDAFTRDNNGRSAYEDDGDGDESDAEEDIA